MITDEQAREAIATCVSCWMDMDGRHGIDHTEEELLEWLNAAERTHGKEPVSADGRELLRVVASMTEDELEFGYDVNRGADCCFDRAIYAYRDSLGLAVPDGWTQDHPEPGKRYRKGPAVVERRDGYSDYIACVKCFRGTWWATPFPLPLPEAFAAAEKMLKALGGAE